jgi:hypothetical protein
MEPTHRQELERWAEVLLRSDVAELRAAGRAIRSLCGENVELEKRMARLEEHARAERPSGADDDDEDAAGPRRLRRAAPWRRVLSRSRPSTAGHEGK